MPEGDTVWLTAQRLHRGLAGVVLRRSDLRVPQLATADLVGRTVVEVRSRGKHLLTRVDGGLTLHTHLRMQGSWHLYRPGARWAGGRSHEVRVVLGSSEWTAVGFRLPVVDLLPTVEEDRVVGHLGPDLLGGDWDTDEAVRRLRAHPGRPIGEALLDQRMLAGIGTLYRAESLFLSGVHPWAPVGDVPDLAGLVECARVLLLANREHAAQVTTRDPRPGRQHWVFERAGRPCRRCGASVRRAEQGAPPRQRLTYWCPRCQRRSEPAGRAIGPVGAAAPA